MELPILIATKIPMIAPIPENITDEKEKIPAPQSAGTKEPIKEPIITLNQINHFGIIFFTYFSASISHLPKNAPCSYFGISGFFLLNNR
jgi:hypothetical protein